MTLASISCLHPLDTRESARDGLGIALAPPRPSVHDEHHSERAVWRRASSRGKRLVAGACGISGEMALSPCAAARSGRSILATTKRSVALSCSAPSTCRWYPGSSLPYDDLLHDTHVFSVVKTPEDRSDGFRHFLQQCPLTGDGPDVRRTRSMYS